MGIATDVRGLKVLYIPPRYLDPNASDEDKAVFEYYKDIMRNIHKNEQSGIILPQVLDDKGEQYFKFELLGINGQKSFDISEVISRYEKAIITALMASQMILGQSGGGSYSLAESLSNVSEMAIESKLREIEEQLNHDLIPQLFQLNGFDTTVTPMFKFGSVDKADLDVLSKFLQRAGAVGLIAQDADTINWVARQANMPIPFDDNTPIDDVREQLTTFTSASGSGMKEGLSNGTGKATGGGDTSTGNMANKSTSQMKVVKEDEHGVTVQFGDKTTVFTAEDWKDLIGDNS